MEPTDEIIWEEYCRGPLFKSLQELDEYWRRESEIAAQEADIAAERACERYYEDRGYDDAAYDRMMEDSRGVVQFEDAFAASITEKTGMEYRTL